MNKIDFSTEPAEASKYKIDNDDGAKSKALCPMPIQKETPTGLTDTVCNGDVAKHQAGLCRSVLSSCIFLTQYFFGS